MLKIITRIYRNTGNTDVLKIAVDKGWITEKQHKKLLTENNK